LAILDFGLGVEEARLCCRKSNDWEIFFLCKLLLL